MVEPPAAPQLPNPLTLIPIPDIKPVQAFLDGLQQGVKGVGDGAISTVNQLVGGLNGTLTQGLDTVTKLAKAPFDAVNQGLEQAKAGAPGAPDLTGGNGGGGGGGAGQQQRFAPPPAPAPQPPSEYRVHIRV